MLNENFTSFCPSSPLKNAEATKKKPPNKKAEAKR